MDGGSDPLLTILQTGMLKMKPRERLSAHECLKRSKTDLFSNDILDIGGATQTEKTALWGEIANRPSKAKSRLISLKRYCRKRPRSITLLMIIVVPVIRRRGSFEVKRSQILKMMAILKVILEKKMVRAINNWRDVQSLMVVKQLSSKAKSRFISLKRYCRERRCRITLLMIMAVLLIRMRGSFEAGKRLQILTMMAILKVPLERRMARSMNNWRGIQSLMVVTHPSKKEL